MNYALPRVSFLPVAVLTLVVAGGWGCSEPTKPSQTQTLATSFTAIAAGDRHTCALTSSGAAYCWGADYYGQLGDGSIQATSNVPVPVAGGLRFNAIAVGELHTCALTSTGVAYCWGANWYGQLGNGTILPDDPSTPGDSFPVPVSVPSSLSFTTLTAGLSYTCGLAKSGAAYCWGSGLGGALGNSTTLQSAVPVAVSGGLSFAALAVAEGGTLSPCGVAASGAAYCWGHNTYGQLGDSSTADALVPVAVVGGLTFSSLGAGLYHTCGITTSGRAYCWGLSRTGQLGDGSTTGPDDCGQPCSMEPIAVAGSLTFNKVAGGAGFTCGLTGAGAAYCWGAGYAGELGDSSTMTAWTPVPVAGGHSFGAIAAGGSHACGISQGIAYCWGSNDYGELGNGTTTNSLVPVPVRMP